MITNEKAEKYIAIFFTLMVCTTRISMPVGHVFMALASILTLYMVWKNRSNLSLDLGVKKMILAYGIMLLCFIPSVICSYEFARSLKVFADSWIYRSLVFLGIICFVNSKKYLNNMLRAFLLVECIDFICALYQFFVLHSNRAWGFGSGALVFGGLIIMLFPIALFLTFDDTVDSKLKKIAKLHLVMLLTAFFSNQSRSTWLLAAVSGPIAIWKNLIASKKKLAVFLAVVVCILGFFASRPLYRNRLMSVTNFTTDRSNGDRIEVWKGAYMILLDNPLTGVGPDAFKEIYQKQYRTKADTQNLIHAHNNFVQIAAEEGSIGFLGFVYFVIVFCWESLKSYFKTKNPYDLLAFLTFFDYVVIYGMIEYGMDLSANVRIMWFLIAILLKMRNFYDAKG